MKIDPIRMKQYLAEIRKNSLELNQLIDRNELMPDTIPIKAAKYMLIDNVMKGRHDFDRFIEEIDVYLHITNRQDDQESES